MGRVLRHPSLPLLFNLSKLTRRDGTKINLLGVFVAEQHATGQLGSIEQHAEP
jgi:hypothetical protein